MERVQTPVDIQAGMARRAPHCRRASVHKLDMSGLSLCVGEQPHDTSPFFACTECGYENHADVVGAMNVLAAGHAVLACGEPVLSGHSAKQEPAEGAQ